MAVVVHLWALPRCNSTAVMYSFAQRGDAVVADEPLYAGWLAAHPDEFRPCADRAADRSRVQTLAHGPPRSYRAELLATPPQPAEDVMAALQVRAAADRLCGRSRAGRATRSSLRSSAAQAMIAMPAS